MKLGLLPADLRRAETAPTRDLLKTSDRHRAAEDGALRAERPPHGTRDPAAGGPAPHPSPRGGVSLDQGAQAAKEIEPARGRGGS
ncbi:hypothetical protein [Amycolatopsis sp. Hca4]|uniref:hypothetical protein n=1 Tax=Amycolatopsis sp. Hca4 TaxID=2742131 RepID=UPI0020CAE91F|nr:hypothetical protein [Amycolatopsis sp. Hca4]